MLGPLIQSVMMLEILLVKESFIFSQFYLHHQPVLEQSLHVMMAPVFPQNMNVMIKLIVQIIQMKLIVVCGT